MKKTMIVLAAAITFTACNNTSETKVTTNSTTVSTDSTTISVDSVKADVKLLKVK
jgi:uncharacterized lipoprotein YajG